MRQRVPVSTYRLQLGPDFTFDDATGVLDHLHRLGITDVYLSPILAAAPGSTHGYDVVDHGRVSEVLGGREAFEEFSRCAHGLDMGVIVDVVPNHMAIPVPECDNRQLWDVLAHGHHSQYADWFDIDFAAEDRVVLPFLGRPLEQVLAAGELSVADLDDPEHGLPAGHRVLCYFDHRFPLRPGTEDLPLAELLDRQHYRLAYWATGGVNYRRFFDVDSLIAVRVEDEHVFAATHRLLLELIETGWIDGLRIDHPDGLADPGAYLERLARATGGTWTAVEKILAKNEQLPQNWPVAGTTGYDAAWRITQVLTEPTGAPALREVMDSFAAESLQRVRTEAKRQVTTTTLRAELDRISRLLRRICTDDLLLADYSLPGLRSAVVELVVAADRYRAHSPGPGAVEDSTAIVHSWRRAAARRLDPAQQTALDLVTALVLGESAGTPGREADPVRQELQVRFQQLCGAVMAKGIEDTTYYRWTHLVSLCEVGGAPEQFAIEPGDLYRWAEHIQAHWPHTLTALSTHDAKRSEDVRARIGVLSEYATEWAGQVDALRAASAGIRPDLEPHTEYLLWQTLAGTWTEDGPPDSSRLAGYMIKASREAGLWTTWTRQDSRREQQLMDFIAALLASEPVQDLMSRWREHVGDSVRAAVLGARALQLTLPGVADTYQGTQVTTTALTDPDNRRLVDYETIGAALDRLEAGAAPWDLASEKLHLTARLLRLRRRRPDLFVGQGAGFAPLAVTSGSAIAFARTGDGAPGVVTVVTRRRKRLEDDGGWQNHQVQLPPGQWRNVLTGTEFEGGRALLAELLAAGPVAVLERLQ